MAVIGISGSYGGLNVGDEAILSSILATWRHARDGAAAGEDVGAGGSWAGDDWSTDGSAGADELVVFSRNPEHTRMRHRAARVVPVRELSRDEVVPQVERLDLLLLGGGGILYDGESRTYLREVRLAQERGIPTMAYAVGAGPLDDPHDREAVCEALSRMQAVTVRDTGAKRTLEHIGLDCPVEVTADPALLLTPDKFPVEGLVGEGVPEERHLVGISVREPGKAAPDLGVDDYHSLIAQAADYAVHRFDAEAVFIPMERDDIRHAHAVIAQMVGADRAHVLKRGAYPPQQLLGLMEHLDLVVGMRLHVLIFAAVAGTPFLPLPYASKVTEFVTAVGVPPPASVTRQSAGPLLAAIDRVWDDRVAESRRLEAPVRALQDRAGRTVRVALEVLDGRPEAPAPAPSP
jgi:polysaccharide pyruvyl transferase CsaB